MIFPRRGEVWWLQGNLASGSEQMNSRPVVIVSNDKNNYYSPNVTVVPFTSKQKKALPTHVQVKLSNIEGTILCEQVNVASKSRLISKVDDASSVLPQIEHAIKIQCGMENL